MTGSNLARSTELPHRDEPTVLGERSIPGQEVFSLVDLAVLVVRKRFVVLSVFLLTMAGTTILYFVTPQEYESQAILQLASKENLPEKFPGIFPTAATIEQRLVEEYDIDNKARRPLMVPRVHTVRRFAELLFIGARGSEPAMTKEFLDSVVTRLMTEVAAPVEKAQAIQTQYLAEQQKRIDALFEESAKISAQVQNTAGRDPALQGLLSIESEKIAARATDLRQQLLKTEMELVSLNSNIFRVVRAPEIAGNGNPMEPKPVRMFTVGALLGLFLGVLAVFALYFLESVRQRLPTAVR